MPGKFQRQRSLTGNSPEGHRERVILSTHTHLISDQEEPLHRPWKARSVHHWRLLLLILQQNASLRTPLTSIKSKKMENKKPTVEKVLTVSVKQCGSQKTKTSTIIPASCIKALLHLLIPFLECGVEINEDPSSKFFFFFFKSELL